MFRTPEEYDAARERRATEAAQERARSETLWRRLQDSGDRKGWRNLVLNDPEFQSFALCEKLCHESADLAEDDAERAFELASLALELAPRVAGDEHRRAGMQQYAWMHLGNVLRARGDLKAAHEALERGKEFFLASLPPSLPSLILSDRLAKLETALLRDQGNLPEALRQTRHAISLASADGAILPALFLEAGRLHRWLGRPEESLENLALAGRTGQAPDSRLLVHIELERGNVLCDLGRHGEVEKLPGHLRKTAEAFPRERARFRCLQGRIAAGLGRLEEAEAALRKGRKDLEDRAVTDLALLSLEIAALYLRQGQTAKLKTLAEETLGLVEAPCLSREGAATLKLFCRLAAQEKLSFERALQFVRDFSRIVPAR